jgi:hypothetical protein
MTTIAEGAAALGAAINLSKELIGVNRSFNEAEFKLKIADLTSSLATVKISLADAQQQLQQRDSEIGSLKKNLAFREDLVETNGFKYRKQGDGSPIGTAFCPVCEQKNGNFFNLVRTQKPGIPYCCPSCKSDFGHVAAYQQR